MSQRYSLRIESGERQGETVPIRGLPFTIGRKAGNGLQIVDPSVSGKHAEIVAQGGEVVLRDLGSTNGTRLGAERVEEASLIGGARFSLGNVAFAFLDGTEEPAAAGARGGLSATAVRRAAGEDALSVAPDAKILARARKGSRTGLLALAGLTALAAGVFAWQRTGGGASGEEGKPLRAFPGASFTSSFEPAEPSWEPVGEGTATFLGGSRGSFSGAGVMGAELAAGESAGLASPTFPVTPGRALTVAAELRAPAAAGVRLGIEFLPVEGIDRAPASPTSAWSDALRDSDTYRTVELAVTAPGGYDRARVLLAAEAGAAGADGAGGSVQVDDVRVVPGGEAPRELAVDAFRWQPIGGAANLFLVDRVLLSSVGLRREGAPPTEWVDAPIGAEANGVRIGPLGQAATLVARVEPALAAGGLATLGPDGYLPRGEDFEASAVTDLVLGRGVDLVRLALGEPLAVRGRMESGGWRLRVDLPQGRSVLVQVGFQAERQATVDLVADAEDAARRGEVGKSLAAWQALLDRYPFEEAVVQRAQRERARALQQGFEELRAVSDTLERAEFFRLAELYRDCRERAAAIGLRFAGSEVALAADAVAARATRALGELGADGDDLERLRRAGILHYLETQGPGGPGALASELRAALEQAPGEEPRD